VEELQAILAQ